MMSRGDGGIPRREPIRTTTEEVPTPAHAPPVKTILDELRQWSLCKTFVHQFKVMAARVIPHLQPTRKRKKGDGDGHPWQRRYRSFKAKLKRKPEKQQEPPSAPLVPVVDVEADEHRTAEEVTRPAVNHVARSSFSAFKFD